MSYILFTTVVLWSIRYIFRFDKFIILNYESFHFDNWSCIIRKVRYWSSKQQITFERVVKTLSFKLSVNRLRFHTIAYMYLEVLFYRLYSRRHIQLSLNMQKIHKLRSLNRAVQFQHVDFINGFWRSIPKEVIFWRIAAA